MLAEEAKKAEAAALALAKEEAERKR